MVPDEHAGASPKQAAPSIPSLDAFVAQLTISGVMSPAELDALMKSLPADKPASDAATLARELVDAGKLTKYQAAAVFQGKTRGLVYGDYVVLDRLGAGGMGQVYKARHRRMDRMVALKVLPAAAMKSPDAVQRFQREVKAAARLIHANIVTAFDAGEQDGVHYLVMELVDGTDLSNLVKTGGPLPVKQAVGFVVQAARGLEHAHAEGVIHRDIKPSNLLVDKKGTVKILDMGLARMDGPLADAGAEGLTSSGSIMGTIDFMAPEQALDTKHADQKSDIYGLGCTLFYLLTGKKPFDADTMMKKLLAHREGAIPSLVAARPEVPPAVDAVYQRMVAKRPADRYQTMTEARMALESAANRTAAAPVAAAELPRGKMITPEQPAESRKRGKKKAKSPVPLYAGAAVGLLALVGGGFALKGMLSKPESPASSAVTAEVGAKSETLRDKPVGPSPDTVASKSADTPAADTSLKTVSPPPRQAADRRAAEWALGVGGKLQVVVGGRTWKVSKLDQLPSDAFQLDSIDLRNNAQIDDNDLAALDGLKVLKSLDVGWTNVTNEAVGHIAPLESLTTLIVSHTAIDDAGFEQLAKLPHLATLHAIGTKLTDRGAAALAKCKSLSLLYAGGTQLTDAGVSELARLPLRGIGIGNTRVTDAGVRTLETCPELHSLWIPGVNLTDVAVASMAKMPKLDTLDIRSTNLSDASVDKLAGMKLLKDLSVTDCGISTAGINRLKSALSDCKIDSTTHWQAGTSAAAVATTSAPATTPTTPAPGIAPIADVRLNPAIERKAAEWALSMGGKVQIKTAGGGTPTLTAPAQLPAAPFTVVDINLMGRTEVTDQSLRVLDGLSELAHLDLRNTSITDGVAAAASDAAALATWPSSSAWAPASPAT